MKRRTWLIGSAAAVGGVLTVGVAGLAARDSHFEKRAAQAGSSAAPLLAGWVQVAGDGAVTVLVPHSDMGQGSATALAMMVAEELDADWAQVRVAQAPADPAFANRFFVGAFLMKGPAPAGFERAAEVAFGEVARLASMQVTGGSAAVRYTGQFGLRAAGAAAREMLVAAGAQKLGVPAAELRTQGGRVVHAGSGRSIAYGELAGAAATLDVPRHPRLKPRSEFRLVGTAPPRLDIPAKVTGRTKYGIDVQLPGMLVATVRAAPVHGERLLEVADAPALAVAGVRKVLRLPNAVAVVADGYWQARTALGKLKPVFTATASEGVNSASISRQFDVALASADGKKLVSRGDVAKAEGRVVQAAYEVPFLHHATMEPINVTAQWDGKRMRVWGSEQDALGARNNVAKAAGISLDDVEFTPMSLGGGFGRRSAPKKDHLEQAVHIAKAMSPAPVKLIWSREEDFAQGAYRPAIATRIEAKLDAQGRIASWRQRFIDTPELINEGFPIPYDVPNQLMEAVVSPTHVRYGAWRSVAHSQHGFFTESFIDELAAAAKMDPLEFRRRHVPAGSRHRKVLDEVARRSGWGTPLPAGRGRGVALVESFGSVVAEVVEASLSEGKVQVHRITAVVDCGYVVHKDTGAQQVQGGIVMGLSAAMGEAITIENGAVAQRSFPDYPLLQLAQVPPIDVFFVESDGPLGGLGEVGLPPVAPALANAVHAASGRRLRSLPLRQSAQSQA
ncbi:xanthine dehydrogenase family protein molybdopterin-binding subunit [Ramlibacter albus]|uniref:Xanthine dehydrogenase family protein molybdopterin-binding subunit n=1 Tax=Ramlibacter albus TaxID=2079448 RepID=A0A923S107_9BURK|nr:molybdopterin cofactor-binding domain-containing protein [Ramlibacter albus]MBC5763148.1 xanthine dehydrogenase family protein molybdopterin-binding subunit [Ramlibacter albus]